MEVVSITLIIIAVLYYFGKSKKKRKIENKTMSTQAKSKSTAHQVKEARPLVTAEKRLSNIQGRWYRPGSGPTFKGFDLTGGFVYFGNSLESLSKEVRSASEASLISPLLDIRSRAKSTIRGELPYYPSYESMTPVNRSEYLTWLAEGRQDQGIDIGFVFVYLYGFERRLILDRSDLGEGERIEILNELNRLYHLYGTSKSFRAYLTNLVALDWVLSPIGTPVPAIVDLSNRHLSVPFQIHLGRIVTAGLPISWQTAIQWMNLHPEHNFRTPARRCPEEFKEIFSIRYAKKYGEGFLVKPNKTPIRLGYPAASPSLLGEINLNFPDLCNPFDLVGPLKKISELAEECTAELDSYSRYIARKNVDPKSPSARRLLPSDISIATQEVHRLKGILERLCPEGLVFLKLKDLYEEATLQIPAELNKAASLELAEIMQSSGFGLAPDIRIHNLKPDIEGGVVIYRAESPPILDISRDFQVIGTLIRLGSLVSQVDGRLHPGEESILAKIVTDSKLRPGEKSSLLAFVHWCVRTPQGKAGLKQKLADLSGREKEAISHVLISVANADGLIDKKEIREIEKLYELLGLVPRHIDVKAYYT